MQPQTYRDNFFEYHLQGALSSAEVIVPMVREYVSPASVIDIGCGIGAWLSIWKKNEVANILGIDGDYVDTSKLLIEKSEFKAFNLENNFTSGEKYDLVTCLEVAEHILPSSAEKFIGSLCALGNIILFSAAIPGQEGTLHVNEQYPEYWVALFRKNGFVPVDCLRTRIWDDKRIQWWYRQNIMFFVRKTVLSDYPKLNELALKNSEALALVHPEMLKEKIRKIDYNESVLSSGRATLRYFLSNLFKKKKG